LLPDWTKNSNPRLPNHGISTASSASQRGTDGWGLKALRPAGRVPQCLSSPSARIELRSPFLQVHPLAHSGGMSKLRCLLCLETQIGVVGWWNKLESPWSNQ
jgi:hypothetical protein